MIKALLLLFAPVQAWDRVVRAQRGFAFVFVLYLMPMVLISCAAEGFGLVRWGVRQEETDRVRTFALNEVIVYEIGHVLLTLIAVFAGAKAIKGLGETFHGRHSFTQAFTAVAYGLSPMFLLRLLDALPGLGPWTSRVVWAIGIVLCVSVLYHGVPRVMMPDPPHAFGLYLMSSLLLVMITGLARFGTAYYLQGYFKPIQNVIERLAGKLPF